MILIGILLMILGILSAAVGVLMLVGSSVQLFLFFAILAALLITLSSRARGRKGNGRVLIVLAVLLIGSAIAFGASGEDAPKPVRVGSGQIGEGTIAAPAGPEEYGPGDTVELNGVRITFHGVNETIGTDLWQPETNKIFAIAEFTVENESSDTINISSVFGTSAFCDDYVVQQSMAAELGDPQGREGLTGSVPPGRKLRGIVGYELPQQWQKLEIRIQTDWWKGSRGGEITFTAVAN